MILVLWTGKNRFCATFDHEPLRFVENSVQKCYAFGNLSGNVSDHEEEPKLSNMDGGIV
jgi:hypothetical protein